MHTRIRRWRFCAFVLAAIALSSFPATAVTLGGVNLGNLPDYLFVFTDGSTDANWQGATKGFIGDVAVDGIQASERTSGTVPYAGTIYTNDVNLGAWQNIVNAPVNTGQAFGVTGQVGRISGLEADLASAFAQINALPATPGFTSRSAASLNGLNTTGSGNQTFVINITSGFQVSTKINITGDPGDIFILRWDTDANPANGYQGQVKFQSGGAIVPQGGLVPSNFINVAGDISSSGGGSNPAPPYPQGPRTNNGTGTLINGGSDWNGGGFFTGYWLTTGDPVSQQTHSLSNAIFVGGWYTSTTKFSMTSGTSGVYVAPPSGPAPPTPCIQVTKTVAPTQAEVGGQVTYTIVVENCGNVTLSNITLSDTVYGSLTALLPTTVLLAGESTSFNFNYTIQDTDPDPLDNVVTVQGTSPQDVTVMDTDDATVDILPPPPPNLVSISGGSFNDLNGNGVLDPGEPALPGATFTLTDCNGNPVLDANGMPVGPQMGSTYNFTNLNPGCYIVMETNPAGFVSTNAIPGSCAGSIKVNNDKIQVQANTPGVACVNNNFLDTQASPCISVEKTVFPTQLLAAVGGPVTYTYTVTNCGNVLLSNVTVSDNVVPGVNAAFLLANGGNTLAPGASVMFSAPFVVPPSPPSPDPLVNIVTATGTDPLGTQVTDDAQAQVDFIPLVMNGSITIAGGSFLDLNCNGMIDPGEPPLDGATFTLTDTLGNPVLDINGMPVAPQTGSSYMFTNIPTGPGFVYWVTETNPAGYTSSAAIPGSCVGTVVVNPDRLAIPASVPNSSCINNDFLDCLAEGCIEITKSVMPTSGPVGTPITYTFVVHNCGTVDLTITSIMDTILGDITAAFVADHGGAVLVAGASETFTVASTIPGDQGNPVMNVVTVTGVGPDGTPFSDDDGATVAIPITISGGAFDDADCSGALDPGELPLPGATFVLTDINGNPVVDLNGNPVLAQMGSTFSFTNLAPGEYKVTEINPMGFTSTNAIPGTGGTKLTNDMIRVDAVGGIIFPDQIFLDGQCEQLVYQAYPGNSFGTNVGFAGYAGPTGDQTTSVPGILQIIPQDNGEPFWANFIHGFMDGTYTSSEQLKRVTLTKQTPELLQCADVFPVRTIRQQGTVNIRTWWPLMFETPGTTWTLDIEWGTGTPPYFHTETWVWRLDATLQSLKDTLQLFHELPYGRTQTPLVSDECLYPILQAKLDAIIAAINNSNLGLAGEILGDFEMEVADAWLMVIPQSPNPCGPGTGIVETAENPAVCKLLSDAGYIGAKYGIFTPSK